MKNLKKIYHSLVLFSVPLCWKLEQLVKWSFLQQTLQDWKVLNKLTFRVSLTASVLWTAGQGAVAYNQFFTAFACWNNSITQWHVTFCRRKKQTVFMYLKPTATMSAYSTSPCRPPSLTQGWYSSIQCHCASKVKLFPEQVFTCPASTDENFFLNKSTTQCQLQVAEEQKYQISWTICSFSLRMFLKSKYLLLNALAVMSIFLLLRTMAILNISRQWSPHRVLLSEIQKNGTSCQRALHLTPRHS